MKDLTIGFDIDETLLCPSVQKAKAVIWKSLGTDCALKKIAEVFKVLQTPLPDALSCEAYYQKRDALFSLKVLFETKTVSDRRIGECIVDKLGVLYCDVLTDINYLIEMRNAYRHSDKLMMSVEEDYGCLKAELEKLACSARPIEILRRAP